MTIETQIGEAVAAAVANELDGRLSEISERLRDLQSGDRPEKLITKAQLAEHLGCSKRTIETLMTSGAPCIRLGGPGGSPRFLASAVVAWMASRHTEVA